MTDTAGRLDGMTAFMGGRLRIAGDMGLAMQMQNLFKMDSCRRPPGTRSGLDPGA